MPARPPSSAQMTSPIPSTMFAGAGQNEAQRDLLHRRQGFGSLQRDAVLVQVEHHCRKRGDAELEIDQRFQALPW